MSVEKRTQNERRFGQWNQGPQGRRYWTDVIGRSGWRARYVKEVDEEENTLRFYQEVYDSAGALVEVHEKFPIDTGHRPVPRKE